MEQPYTPHFDRFDIVEAHYLYCLSWHGGQNTWQYKRQCMITHTLKFKASDGFHKSLSRNAVEIYLNLIAKHEGQEAFYKADEEWFGPVAGREDD